MALEKSGVQVTEQRWSYLPRSTVRLEGETAKKMLKLMGALEENDDVQSVYANFEVDDSLIQEMS